MDERPNILLITTDQQRFDTINAAGNPYILTPHLNWMIDQGIHFSRCYSDCPVCMPARATIMTGLHAYNMGLTENRADIVPLRGRPTLPGLLTAAGYQTRAVGKMHFEPLRANYGFEHMELLPDYYRAMARLGHTVQPMAHGLGQNELEPAISTVDETHSLTHWTAERSIDFLETRDNTRPFFLWTSFAKPHPPLDPCLNYWLMYQNRDVPEPVVGDWSAAPQDVPAGLATYTYLLNNADRFSPRTIADARRAYYACITQIDYSIGLLLARLRELDLLHTTWIVFTSDHGEMLGDHHLGSKSVMLEGSAHVPMLVRPPVDWNETHPRAGTRCDELVCLADVLPTCLAAAGVAAPPGIDGRNMLDVAAGKAGRERIIAQHSGMHGGYYCVIEGAWKYHYTMEGGSELLFDITKDPYEQHNLAKSPRHARELKRLRGILVKSLSARNDRGVKDGKLVAAPIRPARELRSRWPGFHSTQDVNDVLH